MAKTAGKRLEDLEAAVNPEGELKYVYAKETSDNPDLFELFKDGERITMPRADLEATLDREYGPGGYQLVLVTYTRQKPPSWGKPAGSES